VAANRHLRRSMQEAGEAIGASVYHPPIHLCTDNGAMIAGIAYHKFQQGYLDGLDLNASASASIL